jgi:hypothetical protein
MTKIRGPDGIIAAEIIGKLIADARNVRLSNSGPPNVELNQISA